MTKDAYRRYGRAWYLRNKERADAYQKAYKQDWPERLKQYGLTIDEYAAMDEDQDWACLICKQVEKRKLCIDHDHETGRVRGLLCHRCNRAAGLLRDDPVVIRRLADHVE